MCFNHPQNDIQSASSLDPQKTLTPDTSITRQLIPRAAPHFPLAFAFSVCMATAFLSSCVSLTCCPLPLYCCFFSILHESLACSETMALKGSGHHHYHHMTQHWRKLCHWSLTDTTAQVYGTIHSGKMHLLATESITITKDAMCFFLKGELEWLRLARALNVSQ